MNSKKSQITVFIIIGIVILLAASFFLYYKNFIIKEPEFIPADLMPIKNYVESCLNSLGEEAAIKLGAQSGYIKIPDTIMLAEAYIQIIPRGSILIPYWYYNGFDYTPSIEVMQKQISDYVKNNVNNCINLELFQNDYQIKYKNVTEVETIIADEDVDISMKYELEIVTKSTNDITKISMFQSTIPVRLKKAYELGKKIMEAENSKTYFENLTIDWLSMNPKIPLNGIEFHCNDLTWRLSDIKEELQNTIYYNIPSVMVKNTDHPKFLEKDSVYEKLKKYTLEDINKGDYPNIETPADAYDYSHYLLDARAPITDLKAGFYYNPIWDMEITARPSENNIMHSTKQEGSDEFLSFMCLNTYHFTYDIIYPVEVLVRDDKSFNGKGYVFRYAFPVMINHNQPDRQGFLNPEFIVSGDFTGACDNLNGPEYDIRVQGVDEFGIANMELSDVNITYDCYRFKCSLGQTKADEGSYRLRTQLPSSCAHGFIVAEKQGYLKSKEQVLDSQDIDIDLKKLKTMDFEVVADNYNSINGAFDINDQLITYPFSAYLNIQSYDDPSLIISQKFPFDSGSETMQIIEQNSKYKLEIMVLDEADGVIVGGYKANWTLRYDDIAQSSKIRFHALNYLPKPMNSDAESTAIKFLEENKVYKDKLKPELIR